MLKNIQVSVTLAPNIPCKQVQVTSPDMHLKCDEETVRATKRYFQMVCMKFGVDRVINNEYTEIDEEFAKGGIRNVHFDNWSGSSFVLRFTHDYVGSDHYFFMTVVPVCNFPDKVTVGFYQKAAL